MLPEYIPSPSEGVWHLAGFPIRGYALCIIAGIVAAIWIAERRWKARGGTYGEIQDIAIWAVPFGLVGGRVYSLATDHDRYFGSGKAWWEPLAVWHGGLGIWGAVLLGGLGAWIGAHRKGINFAALADTVAPALLIAQAIGRWGNWFNQELYGRPTKLPWGLEIDSMHRVPGYEDALPQLKPGAPKLTVQSEKTLVIDLNDYVVAAGGKHIRLTDASHVHATHANGDSLVRDNHTLVFTSAARYFGPASISFEVTDGSSASDPKGHIATLALPIVRSGSGVSACSDSATARSDLLASLTA